MRRHGVVNTTRAERGMAMVRRVTRAAGERGPPGGGLVVGEDTGRPIVIETEVS